MSQAVKKANTNSLKPEEDPCSYFYLTNVAIERVDDLIDKELALEIADLWVRDMEDLDDDGKCYPLVSATPSRWEVKGAIEMPCRVRELRCEIHCANGHTYAIVDCTVKFSLRETQSKEGFRKTMEGSGESESMVISWDFAKECADLGLAAHINACSCEACIPRLLDTPRVLETLQLALRLTPMSHPSIPQCLVGLAKEHQSAFVMDRDPPHIDDVLSALSDALQITPNSRTDFPSNFARVTDMHWHMLPSNLTQDIFYLDEAISESREAVEATPKEHPILSCRQNTLGNLLDLRFTMGGNPSDLSLSIDIRIKALEARLARSTSLEFLAKELRHSLQAFSQRVNTLVAKGEQILPDCITGEVDAGQRGCDTLNLLCTLGCLLHRRFQCAGASSDMDAAISVWRLLVHTTPESLPQFSVFLSNLGSSLHDRFKNQGDLCDIDEAISVYRKAASRGYDPDCLGHDTERQNGCCASYRVATYLLDKYKTTADLSDLNESISTLQKMVYIDPEDIAHPCAATWIQQLARSFALRFDRTCDPRDISEALSIQEKLVKRTKEDDEAFGARLAALSKILYTRFSKFGNPEDIDRAISLGRRVIQLSSDDPAERADALGSLALCLESKFGACASTEVAGLPEVAPGEVDCPSVSGILALTYLNEAVELQRKVVELTPEESSYLPCRLSNLASYLHRRFHDGTGDTRDIQEALSLQIRAVNLAAGRKSMDEPVCRAQLAEMLHCRYCHTGNDEDRAEMAAHYEGALESPFSIHLPQDRLNDAIRLSRHCGNVTVSIAAYETAIQATTLMIGLDQTLVQRYSRIHTLSKMPLDAAAFACRSNRPDKAVEWLEQGRCFVWGQLSNLRTPLDTLRAHDPELSIEIADVSRRLEEAGSTRPLVDFCMSKYRKLSLDDEARAHAKLARCWEDLLAKARAIPGFQSFLKPLPCSELVEHLPSSGNVVIVTANATQCDAIALVAGLGEPLHIQLPNLTLSKATEYRDILSKKLSALEFRSQVAGKEEFDEDESGTEKRGAGRYRGRDRNVLYVLKSLWIEVVKPVLDALAIPKADDPSISTLHRVWWCPTGVLSFLPLHAAGVYGGACSESVLDYVVSSYTPSISSLLERVRNEREIDETRSGLFLTNQPKVPGYPRISGTTREINTIHDIATERGVRVLKVEGSALSPDDCLKYMEECSSVHFACHGLQSNNEPLKSQLRLEAGALELGAIMQKNLKHADLAFLSACETSAGQEKLDNEAVHLAAGMLAAGYRRVVGTMWEIRDSHAVDVANDFYSYLMDHREEESGSRFDGSRSAHALHHAVRQLRARIDDAREVRGLPDELEKSLLLWIPYVHYGY